MKVAGVTLPNAPVKEWAWSYSKLKNFNTCPKKMYEVDICKNYTDTGEGMVWGNEVHDGLAKACMGKVPLPATMTQWQPWVDKVRAGPGELLVEQKFALTRQFQPTAYFSKKNDVWFRGIGDVVRIDGPVALVLDWKTGKVLDDPPQLMLMAQCIFAQYPNVMRVRSEFVWLKEATTTPEVFTRQDVANQWKDLLPQVNAMEQAHITKTYPPKPSGLCKKHCPVQSCPFHGKGARG